MDQEKYGKYIFQTIKSLQVLQRTETQWNIMVERIFELEDVLKNQICSDRRFSRTFHRERNWFTRFVYTSTVGRLLKIREYPVFVKYTFFRMVLEVYSLWLHTESFSGACWYIFGLCGMVRSNVFQRVPTIVDIRCYCECSENEL